MGWLSRLAALAAEVLRPARRPYDRVQRAVSDLRNVTGLRGAGDVQTAIVPVLPRPCVPGAARRHLRADRAAAAGARRRAVASCHGCGAAPPVAGTQRTDR